MEMNCLQNNIVITELRKNGDGIWFGGLHDQKTKNMIQAAALPTAW